MKRSDYMEKKHHGTPDFPIQYYYIDSSHPQYVMPPHWHRSFEIIRVLEGTLKVFLNNKEYLLEKNEILPVECGYLHRAEPTDCIYECIVFDTNMLKSSPTSAITNFLDPISKAEEDISDKIYPQDTFLYETIYSLFETMRDTPPFFQLKTHALLFEMFYELHVNQAIHLPKKSNISQQVKNISHVLDWIEEHYTEPISLNDLEKLSGFNKKYFCKIFREYTCETPISYITKRRIENACLALKNQKSVTEAAFDSGFNDLSYFCKTFKKIKNVSPSEYKKELSK